MKGNYLGIKPHSMEKQSIRRVQEIHSVLYRFDSDLMK